MGKLCWLAAAGAVVAALLLASILSNGFARVQPVVYRIASEKLTGGLRLALVTDLHSARYGRRQQYLMTMLHDYAPDAVLLGGDIFDGAASMKNAVAFIQAVGAAYPCYFVFGNHEYGTDKLDVVRETLLAAGVTILEGDCVSFTANGQSVCFAGVDDVRCHKKAYTIQLAAVTEALKSETRFSVLLSHEPQFIDELLASRADLIVSGHTHGGQWSIPGLINGLFAPGQGLFPKYAGGLYSFGAQTLVVSRGLAKKPLWAPRLFTPRELVFLDIAPAS